MRTPNAACKGAANHDHADKDADRLLGKVKAHAVTPVQACTEWYSCGDEEIP